MMDQNTKDSTSGKSGAIYEVSSYSSDTSSIHHNAQVDLDPYSSAMVVYQPNDGLVNNDLNVVDISDKCCPVNVARAGGQRLCLSVTTGVHICVDPVIVLPVSMISLTKTALIVWSIDMKHLILYL
jgi:hypothetical protein